MKILIGGAVVIAFCSSLSLFSSLAVAETEEEAMARMQRELNRSLFEPEKQAEPEPPPAPQSEPQVISKPAPPPEPTPVQNAGPADSIYTSFKMDGVSLGMSGSAALSHLQSSGYTCPNQPQMAMLGGRKICMYASMQNARIVMFRASNDAIVEYEYSEVFEGGMPDETFEKAKNKMTAAFGDNLKCKAYRRGTRCDISGNSKYEATVLTSEKDDKATLKYRLAVSR